MTSMSCWAFILVPLAVWIVDAKPDSRMCQPAYDFCSPADRLASSPVDWARMLFRAVSADDLLCMGAFCADAWLVDASYNADCCQAIRVVDEVLKEQSAETLGISDSYKLYLTSLLYVYAPVTGTLFHTAPWWNTLTGNEIEIPEEHFYAFWEIGEPIDYPFWTFARVVLGDTSYGRVRDELESNWPSLLKYLETVYSNEPMTAVRKLKQVLGMLTRINTVEWTIPGRPYPTNLPAVNIVDRTPVELTGIASIERDCYHAAVCQIWSQRTCLTRHPSLRLTWCSGRGNSDISDA